MTETDIKEAIETKKYYTVSEAAKLLGVHRSTIWRWVRNMKIRGRIRVVNNRQEFLGSELMKVFKRI